MAKTRNTGSYSVAELDALMTPFRFLAYHQARGHNEADFLSCHIEGTGKRDAAILAKQLEDKLQPLFPKLMVSVRGVSDEPGMIVNVGNGEEWANLTQPQFKLAELFEKELVKACEEEKLKVVASHNPKYAFIPTGYQRPK